MAGQPLKFYKAGAYDCSGLGASGLEFVRVLVKRWSYADRTIGTNINSNIAPCFCRLPSIASSFGEIIQDRNMFGVPSIPPSFGAKIGNLIGRKPQLK